MVGSLDTLSQSVRCRQHDGKYLLPRQRGNSEPWNLKFSSKSEKPGPGGPPFQGAKGEVLVERHVEDHGLGVDLEEAIAISKK